MIKKTFNDTCAVYSLCGLKFLKIKEKTAKFKVYLFGIPVAIIPKSFIFKSNSQNSIKDFVKFFYKNAKEKSKNFVDIADNLYTRQEDDVKLIAFYLPQFHTFPLNDENFGRGFTEWTNVTKALPHFSGHFQPQLPIDVGFYDLAHDDVMYKQIELAKMYGIYGFCFHYYWFSGDRLLEKPIFNWLNNKDLNFPFCLCWANENWSKLWDGGNKKLLKKQELKDDDDEKFFNDILPFFKDERYIKVNNKPFLIIYNPVMFEKYRLQKFMAYVNEKAKSEGFDGVYFASSTCQKFEQQKEWNFDAIVEFPPHNMKDLRTVNMNNGYYNPDFKASIYDMEDYIENEKYFYETSNNIIKGVFPSWDNTARKAYTGAGVYYGETPELYKKWLSDCIKWTKENHSKEEQFVFINAWNEWAEGAHLEPDQRYGYAYLQATNDALKVESKQKI